MTNARPAFPAAGIRSRAFALIRRCWKPLLIAALIMSMFSLISTVLAYHGDQVAAAATNAAVAEFLADAPAEEGTTEYIEWLYFNEYALEDAAEEAAERALLPWQAATAGVEILGWIVSTFVMLGLNRGLLKAMRNGECTIADLLGGRHGYRRALWTDVVMFLRVFGWTLLAMIPLVILAAVLRGVGLVLCMIGLIVFAIWITLRYMLVDLHIADDAEGTLSASDYIRSSVEDAKYFSAFRMIGVLWPFWLLGLAFALPSILANTIPVMETVALVIATPANVVLGMISPALVVCIYEAIRYEQNAPVHESDGATRAKALAAVEDASDT